MGAVRNGDATGPQLQQRAVDVSIAEFNALRAEIVVRKTTQATLVGVALTAFGVIFGLAAQQRGTDDQLLLVVPLLSGLISLLYARETLLISVIGSYIRGPLWRFLRDQVGEIPSWESHLSEMRKTRRYAPFVITVDAIATGVFLIGSVVALSAANDASHTLRMLGWILTGLFGAASIAVHLNARWRSTYLRA